MQNKNKIHIIPFIEYNLYWVYFFNSISKKGYKTSMTQIKNYSQYSTTQLLFILYA